MNFKINYFSLFLFFIGSFYSCKPAVDDTIVDDDKNTPIKIIDCSSIEEDEAPNYDCVLDNHAAETQYDDIFHTLLLALTQVEDSTKARNFSARGVLHPADCWSSLEYDTINKTIIVHYDSAYCQEDEQLRMGEINVSYTGYIKEVGTVIVGTPVAFYVGGNLKRKKIDGVITITNMGLNSAGKYVYEYKVKDGKVAFDDDGTISWETTRYWVWEKGEETKKNYWDDVFTVYGSAKGVTRSGKNFEVICDKDTPQYYDSKSNCFYLFNSKMAIRGILNFKLDNEPDLTLDYGSQADSCDRKVSVSRCNGHTHDLTIIQ